MSEQDASSAIQCENCGTVLPDGPDLEMLATEVDMALGIEFKRPVQRAEWAAGPPDDLISNLLPWLSNAKERRTIWQRGQDLWTERVTSNQLPPCPSCEAAQLGAAQPDVGEPVREPQPDPSAGMIGSSPWPAVAPEPEALTIHLQPSAIPQPSPVQKSMSASAADDVEVEEHESKTIVGAMIPLDRQGPRLVVITGPVRGYEFSLTRAVTSLGRSVSCQVTVDDPDVAPQHTLILRREDRWLIQDASGSSRTILNDQPVPDSHALKSGDVIQVGSARLRFVEPRPGA